MKLKICLLILVVLLIESLSGGKFQKKGKTRQRQNQGDSRPWQGQQNSRPWQHQQNSRPWQDQQNSRPSQYQKYTRPGKNPSKASLRTPYESESAEDPRDKGVSLSSIVSKRRKSSKGRSMSGGWPSEPEGSPLPDKQCRMVSGRKKRQATVEFNDGDRIHITGYHPKKWMFCLETNPADGTRTYIWGCEWTKQSTWIFENPPWAPDSSWAVIRSAKSGQCLDVHDEKTANWSPVGMYDCHEEATNQLWKVEPDGDGNVYLQDYNSCKCLTIEDVYAEKNSKIYIADCVRNGAKVEQIWTLRYLARAHITLYEHPKWNGEHLYLHSNGECVNVPDWFKDYISSLHYHNNCWTAYKLPGCKGYSVSFFIGAQGVADPGDMAIAGLDNSVRSVKPCNKDKV